VERWRKLRTITNPIVARPQSATNYMNDHNIIINDFINLIKSKINPADKALHLDSFQIDLKLVAFECKVYY
jgi:hypothetical protein